MSVGMLTLSFTQPSERFIRRHLDMLTEAGMLHSIITLDDSEISNRNGVSVHHLTYAPSFAERIVPALRRRILRHEVPTPGHNVLLSEYLSDHASDISVIFVEYANIAVDLRRALLATDKPIYIHVHGYDTHVELHGGDDYAEALVALSAKAQYICTSDEVKSRLTAVGVPVERIIKKPYGVEIPPYRQRPDKETVTILHLGRLVDVKAPELTIRAFERACERGLNGRLVVAGDGGMMPVCRELVEQSPWGERISLPGAVSSEQADQLFREADIFTLHSIRNPHTNRVEAFGVAIVEAMAASLPVVGTAIGGPKEIIIADETGYLGEPMNIEQQAAAFLELANDYEKRIAMGRAGWERAKAHFSYEAEAAQLCNILRVGDSYLP